MSRRSARAPFRVFSPLLLATCLLTACGGDPPDRELQQARAAIEAARVSGAERYATDEYAAAREALRRADEAVQARDYRLALNHALDSLERAQNASNTAAEGRTLARADAERAISAAASAVAAAGASLSAAETGLRQPPRVVEDARLVIADVDRRLQEARTAFAAEDYAAARAAAESIPAAIRPALEAVRDAAVPPARRRR